MGEIEKVKGWLGVLLVVWPIVRTVALAFGVHLPDIGLPIGEAAILSQGAGVALMATSPAIVGKKKEL
jgi:hypothetical protein